MNDNIGMKGEVTVTVIKADGNKTTQKMNNAIDTEIKNAIANGLQSAVNYGLNDSLFATDNFANPDVGGSGIVFKDDNNDYLECKNTAIGNPGSGYGVKLTGSTRATSQEELAGAYMGKSWASDANFDTNYASTTFSQTVNDGQQIDVTWEVTIA